MVFVGKGEVDVEAVLDELDVEVIERGSNILCRCPFHDDAHRSFSISASSGAWTCYAGCGEGGLAHLVAQVLGLGQAAARFWLEDRGPSGGSEEAVMRLLESGQEEKVGERPLFLYETGTTYSYMMNRGFTPETLKAWEVGRDSQRQAVVIPVCFTGELLGLIYRYIYPEVTPPYEYTSGLPKSQLLFGWDKLPPTPERIFVTEGSLDAMWLWQHRYSAVSVLGSRISRSQAELLLRRTREVVLAFDSDKEGLRGTRKAIELLTGRARLRVVRWPPGRKDAQDCGVAELMTSTEDAVDSVLWSALNMAG